MVTGLVGQIGPPAQKLVTLDLKNAHVPALILHRDAEAWCVPETLLTGKPAT